MKKTNQRAQIGLRASIIGLITNAILAMIKITAGLLTETISILADGVNNLSDMGSVLVSFFSLKAARKPEDKEHPFGHARMEYIGSMAIAVIVLYIGIDLLRTSVQTIQSPQIPNFSWWLVGLTAISIPAKLFLWLFYRKWGKKYSLTTILASSQDSFNDVLITSSVLLGLLITHFLKIQTDGWLGLLVSLFILYSGIQMLKGTVNDLLGGAPNQELGKKILDILMQYPQIIGTHDFVLHDYGPGRAMASIHAEVSADEKLIEIHEVIDQAEQQIMSELGLPINIHMDPVVSDDAPGQSRKVLISKFLQQIDPALSLHDFRVVPGKQNIKLIFDIAVPAGYEDSDGLIKKVSDYSKTLDVRHTCVIGIDKDYFITSGTPD